MHRLEYALFAISHILKNKPEKSKEISDELLNLASASHKYTPPPVEHDLSEEWMGDIRKRARGLL
jgi:hypothetical protein